MFSFTVNRSLAAKDLSLTLFKLRRKAQLRIKDEEVLFVTPITQARDQLPKEGVLCLNELRWGRAELPEVRENRDSKDIIGNNGKV
eukprot:13346037-Heterocapsa_arctica.AAC.1